MEKLIKNIIKIVEENKEKNLILSMEFPKNILCDEITQTKALLKLYKNKYKKLSRTRANGSSVFDCEIEEILFTELIEFTNLNKTNNIHNQVRSFMMSLSNQLQSAIPDCCIIIPFSNDNMKLENENINKSPILVFYSKIICFKTLSDPIIENLEIAKKEKFKGEEFSIVLTMSDISICLSLGYWLGFLCENPMLFKFINKNYKTIKEEIIKLRCYEEINNKISEILEPEILLLLETSEE